MTFPADLFEVLNVTGVRDLVQDRIYPGLAPQGATSPYVVYRRNGGDPMATLSGTGTRSRPNVLVFAADADYDVASNIAEAVRAALKAGTSKVKCNSVGLPIDGFDEATRLLTVAVEASVSHIPT